MDRVLVLESHEEKQKKWKTKIKEQLKEFEKKQTKVIKKNESHSLLNTGKINKCITRVQSVEDAIKLVERLSSSSSDGGKGVVQLFSDLENRMKAFTADNFADGVTFKKLEVDHTKRIQAAEDHTLQQLRRLKGLDDQTEMI